MQTDDQLVAVILVLVGARLDREVQVGACDSWQKKVDHGPQLLQCVLQRGVNKQEPLLAGGGNTELGI